MSEKGLYTFGKKEHLCKHTLIDKLFGGEASQQKAWPLRMMYLLADKPNEQDAALQVLVSVSKRYFKRAVKRNRVKRQIREAFRLQRGILMEALEKLPQKQLLVAFIWQDDKLHESELIDHKMAKLLKGLSEKLTDSSVAAKPEEKSDL